MTAGVVAGYVLTSLYVLCLTYVGVFCVFQLHLLWQYLRRRTPYAAGCGEWPADRELPMITIQLPVFNESNVVERLMANIEKMDYPASKLQIQLLDDSTDKTLEISRHEVSRLQASGMDVSLLHRQNRQGYKAGALGEAMESAKGEFIAIFDADFLPYPDFLRKTLACFNDPKTGVVQGRWTHLNQGYSLLTEMQAFQLNVHFTTEQMGRAGGGYFLQFNGTAGVWRKSCIEDSGGWQPDTLTEDLDLSYRAQLKGWKVRYLENVEAPAELPAEIAGLKSQQYRWMKGGAETAKKILPLLWKANISMAQKVHGTYHMLVGTLFPAVFVFSILSLVLLFFRDQYLVVSPYASVYLAGMAIVAAVYYVANVVRCWPRQNALWMHLKFVVFFPLFISMSMAIALHNSLAVVSGYMGKKTAFVRTPKYGVTGSHKKGRLGTYGKISVSSVAELLLGILCLWAVVWGLKTGLNPFINVHAMLATGYLTLTRYEIRNRLGL